MPLFFRHTTLSIYDAVFKLVTQGAIELPAEISSAGGIGIFTIYSLRLVVQINTPLNVTHRKEEYCFCLCDISAAYFNTMSSIFTGG